MMLLHQEKYYELNTNTHIFILDKYTILSTALPYLVFLLELAQL
jgi:hypothetical protein